MSFLSHPHYPTLITTFLPYERSVGFASLRNSGRLTSGIHARPLSKVRCCRPKKFGRLPEGLLYTHQPLYPHNHCKRIIIPRPAPPRLPYKRSVCLASALSHPLFVGEWACPSRCIEPLHPHNHCKMTIIPRPAPSRLPPLSKVRCCRPKKFGRLPEGLPHHHPSLAPTLPKPHYPTHFS